MNTFGTKFRLTTYGESHGLAVGGIIDGCPSNVRLDMEAIRADLARRRIGAPRQEEDEIEWLSGVTYPSVSHAADSSPKTGEQPITLGTPIAFTIRNKDTRSEDYDPLADCYRPGHADYTYQQKYGIRDYRGGGRASARETVARVVAGAIAKQLLSPIAIHAEPDVPSLREGCPQGGVGHPHNQKATDNTYGGTISCRITGLPAGIGNPIFGKLNAQLAFAMMSIPSATGFEMGVGFKAAEMTGSEYIDRWNDCLNALMPDCLSKVAPGTQTIKQSNNQTITKTNHCGGIQGGISNGMPVEFRVAFHPVVTLPGPIECLAADGTLKTLQINGRHDRYHIPRAAVVVEAMTAMVLANYIL